MKIIKTLGLLVLGLVVLALLFGAFLPTHFDFERSAEIGASKEIIFSKLNDLKTWEEWGPWKEMEPTMEVTYGEQTKGVGASYSWTTSEGTGKITIAESTPPTWQKTELVFDESEEATGWFKLEDGENGATKTTWGVGFDIPYPFNAMTLLTGGAMEKQMNEMFDSGLAKLKVMCEKEASQKTYRGYVVKPVVFPGKSYLAVRDMVKFNDIASFFTNNYGAIGAAMGKQQLQMDGMPCGIFYEWNEKENTTDMAAAIPVSGGTPVAAGKVQPIEIPKGECVTIDYYGPYEGTGKAHYAMDDYFKENHLSPSRLVMEEYVTDPSRQPDTSKWLTRVYYFLNEQEEQSE